jgi:hypothetical protein
VKTNVLYSMWRHAVWYKFTTFWRNVLLPASGHKSILNLEKSRSSETTISTTRLHGITPRKQLTIKARLWYHISHRERYFNVHFMATSSPFQKKNNINFTHAQSTRNRLDDVRYGCQESYCYSLIQKCIAYNTTGVLLNGENGLRIINFTERKILLEKMLFAQLQFVTLHGILRQMNPAQLSLLSSEDAHSEQFQISPKSCLSTTRNPTTQTISL